MSPLYRSTKVSSPSAKIPDVADQATISSVTNGSRFDELDINITPAARGGTYFKAVSSPGGITEIGLSPKVSMRGLTPGTSYTFTVTGINGGTSSSASSANTPTGAIVPLATSTLSVAGGFSFGSIPQGYQDLELIVTSQYAAAGDFGSYMNLNGNSQGAVTSWTQLYNVDGGVYAPRATGQIDLNLGLQAGNGVANLFSAQRYKFFNYSSTTRFKTIMMESALDRNGAGSIYGSVAQYRTNVPITAIGFGASSYVNLSAGSTATLYGIKGFE
jgi:hypothetical protein